MSGGGAWLVDDMLIRNIDGVYKTKVICAGADFVSTLSRLCIAQSLRFLVQSPPEKDLLMKFSTLPHLSFSLKQTCAVSMGMVWCW